MGRKASGLAARFRKAVAAEEKARQRSEDARAVRLREAEQARRQLFEDLAEFAAETGFLKAQRKGEGLTLRYGDRYLHFEPRGEGDVVKVELEGAPDEEHALYREAELGDRWVWVRRTRRREERTPFFDRGLEALLVKGLGLPDPNDEADDPSDTRRRL